MATTEKPVLSRYKERMEKAVAALSDEFGSLRTGRASASLLDQIRVDAYGSSVPINQVGAVSVPEPRMLTIGVWDKALVVSVEKAIRASDLGLNPVVDGTTLRLPIPPLTEERRRDLVKSTKQMSEESRIRVRSARREGIEGIRKLGKDGGLAEDTVESCEKEIQKMTDAFVKKIDDTTALKEADIMKV